MRLAAAGGSTGADEPGALSLKGTVWCRRWGAGAASALLLAACGLVWAGRPDSTESVLDRAAAALEETAAAAEAAHERWGGEFLWVRNGLRWWSHRGGERFIPASNTKLFTAALVWDRFGPEGRLRTPVMAASRPDDRGRLDSDLVICGRGDPSWAPAWREGRVEDPLGPLAEAIRAAGVRRVMGRLVLDARLFGWQPLWGTGWEWDDLAEPYAAPATALSVNGNAVTVHVRPGPAPGSSVRVFFEPSGPDPFPVVNRVVTGAPGSEPSVRWRMDPPTGAMVMEGNLPLHGAGWSDSVAVANPLPWFGRLLLEALQRRGVRVEGGLTGGRDQDAAARAAKARTELAAVESPPVPKLLAPILRQSLNQPAQMLCLAAGALGKEPPAADEGFLAEEEVQRSARRALERLLIRLGVPTSEVWIEDGAGLSRGNQVTPRAIAMLLRSLAKRPDWRPLLGLLAAPGEPGTLAGRLGDLPPTIHLRAKTGHLRHVHALSGCFWKGEEPVLVFSLIVNEAVGADPTGGGDQVCRRIDARLRQVAEALAGVDLPDEEP